MNTPAATPDGTANANANATFEPFAPQRSAKFAHMGTTIFSTMSALAAQTGAINLGQGFPDFDCDPQLTQAVTAAMQAGHNQYPPMPGVWALRQAVSHKIEALYGRTYCPDSAISVAAGATQAILTAILAVVQAGDEVLVLDPCYDSYVPNIELAGAVAVRVPLKINPKTGGFAPDFDAVAAAITPRTSALIVNTPHNPTGSVWQRSDWLQLQALLAPTDIVLISDEVYEHMCYRPQRHISCAEFSGLASRAFIVSSFGKTFHVTGWKVGTVAAPPDLMAQWRKVHQFNVFTVNTPMQHALASYMSNPAPYLNLPDFYQRKRDLFRAGLKGTGFVALPCEGTYFQCASYADLAVPERDLNEVDFCQWLTQEVGVAAIPLSAFYGNGLVQKTVRFCFAKQDRTLHAALQKLATLRPTA